MLITIIIFYSVGALVGYILGYNDGKLSVWNHINNDITMRNNQLKAALKRNNK